MIQDKFKKRWVILSIVWAVALMLTYWNVGKIDAIVRDIKVNEIFRQDKRFWEYNSKNISSILKKKKLLSQPVESLKIGLLSVENELKILAAKYNLSTLKLKSYSNKAARGKVPLEIFFMGTFDAALKWLRDVQNNYTYLPVRKVEISIDRAAGRVQFKVALNYRYELSFSKA
jgi:hypothetical protein